MACAGVCHEHINFTTRGKILLMDVEKAKRAEFNRRRKIRLQQVRQQSSEIAKEIRDRVKMEKMLKGSQEQLRKKTQFDKWKESQLKNLKDEFRRRALAVEQEKENALHEEELEKLEKERQLVLDEISKKRGNLAMLKQRKEKLAVETESFMRCSNAKFNRSVENLRSAMVASLPTAQSNHQQLCVSGKEKLVHKELREKAEDDCDKDRTATPHDKSVIKLIGSQHTSIKRPIYVDDELREGGDDSDVTPLSKSSASSPAKRSYAEFIPLSPKNQQPSGSADIFHRLKPHQRSAFSPSQTFAPAKATDAESAVSEEHSSDSLTGSLPSQQYLNTMKSKKITRKCSHTKDTSPVRCDDCYSPNRYKEELDSSRAKESKVKQVRFLNVSSADEPQHLHNSFRERMNSEGDIECDATDKECCQSQSPNKWNKHQSEDVILYDHCGRTSSRYHPSHTVSLIHSHDGEEGLEEEMEACRKKALEKHEEALRERRGCRAMYRERLRAEFSCMMSDLANLDKQSRLAKLETQAKTALLPKKQKTTAAALNKYNKSQEAEINDSPGRVKVMDCIETSQMDVDMEKTGEQIVEKELDRCNLDALDKLLTSLQEQRDYLLACQRAEEESAGKVVQSVSVQCEELPKMTDHATSPRTTSPLADALISQQHDCVDKVKSRSISPIYPNDHDDNSCNSDKNNLHSTTSNGVSSHSSPLISDDCSKHSISHKYSSKSLKHTKYDEIIDGKAICKEMTLSLNNCKKISPGKVRNESNSSVSMDATSYSFDGVKVEVKVTKNKNRRTEKKIEIMTDKYKDDSIRAKPSTIMEKKNDSWAKKLSENNSSDSTAYMSPPEELNSDEHKLLISILEGMQKKNNNPILRSYIQKLLSMSKGSLENMSISMSDASAMSNDYKSCLDTVKYPVNIDDTSRSYMSALSLQDFVIKDDCDALTPSVTKTSKEKVKIILDSDDGADTPEIKHSRATDIGVGSPSIHLPVDPKYFDTLQHFNNRLKMLSKLMSQQNNSLKNYKSESETAYLEIPSDLEDSVQVPPMQELSLPEESLLMDGVDHYICNKLPIDSSSSALDIGLDLLPKPHSFNVKQQFKKTKPPSTIKNNVARRVLSQSVVPHELSTIAEVDSKLSILHGTKKQQQWSTVECDVSCVSARDSIRSETESYHTLPSAGVTPVSSDSSFISSGSVSPVKPADESSLQILTDGPDSSLCGSSAEEMAVSEVFRSLGIGWAVSTWRKTQEASKHCESSSCSDPCDPKTADKKKKEDLRYRHSTPIKSNDPEKNRLVECEEDRLTPPSVTLYQRYQKLVSSNFNS